MRRGSLAWLAAFAVVAVLVAVQVVSAARSDPSKRSSAPTVVSGSDVLAGVAVVATRVRDTDYRRAAFGDAWEDDNDARVDATVATPATTS